MVLQCNLNTLTQCAKLTAPHSDKFEWTRCAKQRVPQIQTLEITPSRNSWTIPRATHKTNCETIWLSLREHTLRQTPCAKQTVSQVQDAFASASCTLHAPNKPTASGMFPRAWPQNWTRRSRLPAPPRPVLMSHGHCLREIQNTLIRCCTTGLCARRLIHYGKLSYASPAPTALAGPHKCGVNKVWARYSHSTLLYSVFDDGLNHHGSMTRASPSGTPDFPTQLRAPHGPALVAPAEHYNVVTCNMEQWARGHSQHARGAQAAP